MKLTKDMLHRHTASEPDVGEYFSLDEKEVKGYPEMAWEVCSELRELGYKDPWFAADIIAYRGPYGKISAYLQPACYDKADSKSEPDSTELDPIYFDEIELEAEEILNTFLPMFQWSSSERMVANG